PSRIEHTAIGTRSGCLSQARLFLPVIDPGALPRRGLSLIWAPHAGCVDGLFASPSNFNEPILPNAVPLYLGDNIMNSAGFIFKNIGYIL
ncbi:MAG: hypothetical protein RRA32_10065, partial [bacterium]|nr:hypothetical protein [bacterium]